MGDDLRQPTLHAGSLVLEPLTAAHAEIMFELLADPAIYRHLDDEPPPTVEQLREVYRRREARVSPDGSQVWFNWVIRDPRGDALGYVQATLDAPERAWIAYVLASRHWGHGFAQAATLAMVQHLREAQGIRVFVASVEAANRRSVRLLRRIGFRLASKPGAFGVRPTPTERIYVLRC